MSAPQIRLATPYDAPALTALVRAAYADYTDLDGLPDVSHGVARDIERHNVWVAEDGKGLVGGVVLAMHGAQAHLMNLAVHPRQKGAGLGTALIGEAEAFARDQGAHSLRLATHAALSKAIRLYTHLGWKIVTHTSHKVVMDKTL